MSNKKDTSEKMKWEIDVPIFQNTLILKQLGLAFGLPFGILIIILVLITTEIRYLFYALALIGVLFLLTYIVIMVLYKGKYSVGFVIDDKGIRCYTQRKQAKKNKTINILAIILGIFFTKPGVAGAGMLAQARQDSRINWNHIKKISYRPRKQMILVKGNFAEHIVVFCTRENYEQVQSIIAAKIP